jgi:hypothetical protein
MKMRLSLGNVSTRTLKAGGAVLAVSAVGGYPVRTLAAPYASNVQITGGTSVSFTLNESADLLSVSVNGGAPQLLDGSAAGTKTFTLPSAGSTFSIEAKKTATTGYTIPTGVNQGSASGGLSLATTQGGTSYVASTTDNLARYNSPRGVSVSTNPNSSNFGIAYIANSAAGTSGTRNVGDGIYAVKGDLTDAYGYGDTAQAGGLQFGGSSSSPFRIQVASDGNVYVSDFSDANGQVARLDPKLTNGNLVLAGTGGTVNQATPDLPTGQNHGSTLAVHAVAGAGGLTLYTLDEDLTSGHVAGTGNTGDYNSLWRYDIGTSALPYGAMPTKLNHLLIGNPTSGTNATPVTPTSDIELGKDGKIYMSQSRSSGTETGVFVVDTDGSTVLFDSLKASRALLGNQTAKDILTNVMAIAISPDQKYMAMMLNGSDVAVLPLVNGIPQLDQRVIVDTGTDVNSGRDIAFDAADNIYYVSSGQGTFRILSPGGVTDTVLSYDGSNFSFANAVPEPGSLAMFGAGALMLMRRARRRG